MKKYYFFVVAQSSTADINERIITTIAFITNERYKIKIIRLDKYILKCY